MFIDYSKIRKVTTPKFIAFSLGSILLVLALIFDNDGFIFIIDHANLVFHEAGHPIFGIFGRTLGIYGGTIGQLVFPIVIAIAFFRKNELLAFAVSLLWLFENFFNIARYMADARTQALPLVGSGDHDWTNILSRWGVLEYDTMLANILSIFGWAGIFLTFAFVVFLWFKCTSTE